jgi:uncharacterized protein (DUF342 family)
MADNPLDIRMSDDQMTVFVSCTAPEDGWNVMLAHIDAAVSKMGVSPGPKRDELEELLQSAAGESDSGDLVDVPVLRGIIPTDPVHGKIVWAADFFNPTFGIDEETGNIDYRQRAAQGSVEEGQLLATIVPPVPGKSGLNLLGEVVAAEDAKSADIRAGRSVTLNEEEGKLYSDVTGRIRWEKPRLSVDTVYTVTGNVGLKTGNVEHPGAVVVLGDVEAGTKLKAEGDVEVRGLVEGAEIEAGGNLMVHNGIIGQKTSVIRVGGSVQVRFINDAEVEADRDVIVEREVSNSKIRTRGALRCPAGRLFGGEIVALSGAHVAQAGSTGMVSTEITVGYDFRLSELLEEPEERVRAMKEQLEKINDTVRPLMKDAKKLAALSEAQRSAVVKIAEQARALQQELGVSIVQMEDIKKDSAERSHFSIVVRGILYSEVVFQMATERTHFKDGLKGPVRAKLVRGEITVS